MLLIVKRGGVDISLTHFNDWQNHMDSLEGEVVLHSTKDAIFGIKNGYK
jgi:hypothetical protein